MSPGTRTAKGVSVIYRFLHRSIPSRLSLPFLLLSFLLSSTSCTHSSEESKNQNKLSSDLLRTPAAFQMPHAAIRTADDFVYPWPFQKTLIGTSHAAPLYDPAGLLAENVLSHGALDARLMGFDVLKIWLGPEIFDSLFYRFEKSVTELPPSFEQMLFSPEYQRAVNLPYSVVVLEYDSYHMWGFPLNKSYTDSDWKKMEEEIYQLSLRILKAYAGSGKVFILQNHEGDNHLADFSNPSVKFPSPNHVQPAPLVYENYRNYFRHRQAGIRRARQDVQAPNVALYQMCEVNAVLRNYAPELLKDQTKQAEAVGQKLVTTSLTKQVLPSLDCDLYGYSAYESIFQDDPKILLRSLDYIRKNAKPSLAFGRNNVVVSEFGIPEREAHFQKILPSFTEKTRQWVKTLNLPMFILWNLYDNECATGDCKKRTEFYENIEAKQARGFWMRTPSGALGKFYQGIQDLVEAQVRLEEVPTLIYQLFLDRNPSPQEFNQAMQSLRTLGRDKYYLQFSNQPEVRSKLIQKVFLKIKKKNPTSEQTQFWQGHLTSLSMAAAANFLISQSLRLDDISRPPDWPVDLNPNLSPQEKARQKLINRLYEGLFDRAPTPEELKISMSSKEACEPLAIRLATSLDFQKATAALDHQAFIQKLYRGLLMRESEPGGVAGWKAALDQGRTRVEAAKGFVGSEEFKNKCRDLHGVP